METSVIPWNELAVQLKPIMEKEQIRKIGHNFKEEYRAFLPYGVSSRRGLCSIR
ncbi:MAG: hypothetical protein ACLTDS_06930 [Bianqueaceae bacterium]